MTTSTHAHGRWRHADHGFTVVEVIIAAFLLALVVVGATIMFSSSQKSSASTKVRDKQTALANQVLSTLQANPSWAPWCRQQPNPMHCNLQSWMQGNGLGNAGAVKDGNQTLQFQVTAVADGIDLPADKLGANDEDGVVPDVYRLKVTISPSQSLASRMGTDLAPFVVESDINPSIRVDSGQVVVDVCVAQNQVDERIAVGDCTGGPSALDLLPPPTLDTTNATTIRNTCDGPMARNRGSDERDCTAFKCADVEISHMANRGLDEDCASFPGWKPPDPNGFEAFLTKVGVRPGSGTIRLKNVQTGAMSSTQTLQNGRVEFRDLPVGTYEVFANINGATRLWQSKSVPSTRRVAVEAGLKSRAVLIYRPNATGTVTIPVRSVDGTVPWATQSWDAWVGMTPAGSLVTSSAPIELCLVPAPQGRLLQSDITCREFRQSMSTTEFTFTGVEPGLYAAMLSFDNYYRFMPLSGTAGFFWVPEGGQAIPKLNGSTAPFEYVNGLCAKDVREAMIPTTNPITGQPFNQPCSSPGGGSGDGGGGGAGTA